ncbi:phage tail assembly protein [Hylemonella gracilis]|nr:phage tail assembly protein [Hylemonella gracilis]
MRKPVEMPLGEPIQAHGQTVNSLTFKPLKGKDIRQMPASRSADALLAMVAISAGIPPSSVDQMDGGDVTRAMEIVSDFLLPVTRIGEASGEKSEPSPPSGTGETTGATATAS